MQPSILGMRQDKGMQRTRLQENVKKDRDVKSEELTGDNNGQNLLKR